MDQKRRNVHFPPGGQFPASDFIQPRHHRIGLIVRLLLRDRQHRADVFFRRRQLLAVKRGGDGLRPASRSLTLAGIFCRTTDATSTGFSPSFSAGACWLVQALSAMAASSVNETGIMRDKRAAIMLPCLD